MENKSKRKYSRKKSSNEFAEIRQLRLSKTPQITKDDITDFIIDMGLANKKLEKLVAENRKNKTLPKSQEKKRCVRRKKKIQLGVKKFVSTLKDIKKNSNSVTTGTR